MVQIEAGDHARFAVGAQDRIAELIPNQIAAEDKGAVEVRAIDLLQTYETPTCPPTRIEWVPAPYVNTLANRVLSVLFSRNSMS